MARKHFVGGRMVGYINNYDTDSHTIGEAGQEAKGRPFPLSHRNLGKGVQNLQEETKYISNRRIISGGKCTVHYYFDNPPYFYQE